MNGLFIFLIALLLNSCASKLTSPPDQEFINEVQKNLKTDQDLPDINKLSEAEREYVVYKKAQYFKETGKRKHSCQWYKYLGRDQLFPLKELAIAESFSVCHYSKNELEFIWKDWNKKVPYFLQKIYIEESLKKAKHFNLLERIVEFNLALIDYTKTDKEREKLVLEAWDTAKKTQSLEIINQVTDSIRKIAPRYLKEHKPEELYSLGRDYEKNRDFSKARKIYRSIINHGTLPLKDKVEAYDRYRMSYKLQRRKDDYAFMTYKMYEWLSKISPSEDDKIFHQKSLLNTGILYSRAIWTQGNLNRGYQFLESLMKKYEMPDFAKEQAYWVLGSMKLEKKKYQEALSFFQLGSELSELSEDYAERFFWAISWNHFLLGELQPAKEALFKALKKVESPYVQRKFKFWIAKISEQLNLKEESQQLFSELWEEDPYGYYGISAKVHLDGNFSKITLEELDFEIENPYLKWLVTFEKWELSQEFLDKDEEGYKTASEIKSYLPIYQKANWHFGGIFKFFKLKPEDRDQVQAQMLSIAFPIPNLDLFNKWSTKFKLDPALALSITRQESAFDPKIRSWADAFGLMQLTPERALIESKSIGLKYKDFNDLYDPDINIAMGTHLLSNLIKKKNFEFISSVASYNASESAVSGWKKTRFRKDPFEFIEMIPYDETQGYVKLVFRNYITYKRIIGEKFNINRNFLWDMK